MDKLKLLWRQPQVAMQTKGLTAWAEEMEQLGFMLTDNPHEADIVFFCSDSQLHVDLIGSRPSLCYFWGWPPERLLDQNFRQHAERQLSMVAQCTRVLVPSPTTRDQLFQFGIPCELCLPGVDTKTFDSVPTQQRQPKVIFISRLVPHKGLEFLIEAVSLIRPQPELLVIGPGDRTPYQEFADKVGVKLTFAELTDYEKAIELKKATVLVHPSMYEGFGMAPVEALACGTPVIALSTPHMRWLLEEDAYYFLSVEGLAGTIKYVFDNTHEAFARAELGRQRIRNIFTWELAAQRLWGQIHQVHKEFWAQVVRQDPSRWVEAYDNEHRRNWNYSVDRLSPEWFRHWRMQFVLKELLGPKVLDIGAGAGTYTIKFALEGYDVTWNDISGEALRQVKVLSEKFGVKDKISFCLGDCQNLPLPDGTFDSVWAGEILEHVLEPQKIISEAARLLKPGGKLIMSTPIGHHHYDAYHLHAWDDESIKKLLEPWKESVVKLEKIAEDNLEPSCYLLVLEKSREVDH